MGHYSMLPRQPRYLNHAIPLNLLETRGIRSSGQDSVIHCLDMGWCWAWSPQMDSHMGWCLASTRSPVSRHPVQHPRAVILIDQQLWANALCLHLA